MYCDHDTLLQAFMSQAYLLLSGFCQSKAGMALQNLFWFRHMRLRCE